MPLFSCSSRAGAQLQSVGKAHLFICYLQCVLALRGEATEYICISAEIFSFLLLMLPYMFPEIGNDMSCEKHLSFITLLICAHCLAGYIWCPTVAKWNTFSWYRGKYLRISSHETEGIAGNWISACRIRKKKKLTLFLALWGIPRIKYKQPILQHLSLKYKRIFSHFVLWCCVVW